MRLLISPAAGWKHVKSEVQESFYFLVSNPPRKVNATDTTRLGSKGEGRDAYTVIYNVLQLPQAGSLNTGRRHPEVALTPRVRPIARIALGHK